jgi:hypothetical protein
MRRVGIRINSNVAMLQRHVLRRYSRKYHIESKRFREIIALLLSSAEKARVLRRNIYSEEDQGSALSETTTLECFRGIPVGAGFGASLEKMSATEHPAA